MIKCLIVNNKQVSTFILPLFSLIESFGFFLENGTEKRKRTKEKSEEREKKPHKTPKEWPTKPVDVPKTKPAPTVPSQITFGRFEFGTPDSIPTKSKKKIIKKQPNKQKKLVNTLKRLKTKKMK